MTLGRNTTVALLLAAGAPALGCGSSSTAPTPTAPAPPAAAAASPSGQPEPGGVAAACEEATMQAETITLRESTNPTLSGRQVGVSNVFERDLPDDQGAVAARLSAVLVIHDPATAASQRQTVTAGTVVTIGEDRYCVVSLEEGQRAPGSVVVRKLATTD